MTNNSEEERRVLILTGASRGIGHATVKRFSSAGWRVISCSRHLFPEDCAWEAGADDHIQVDLADPDVVVRAVAEMKLRLKAQKGRLHALVNNAAISAKGEGGSRLTSLGTRLEDWKTVFQVNFFAPIMLARGLIGELEAAGGRQCQLDRGLARTSLRRLRLCHLQGGARRAHPGDGRRFRAARH